MILTMAFALTFSEPATGGESATARYVSAQVREQNARLMESVALGSEKTLALEDLYSVAQKYSAPNSSGERSDPVSDDVYNYAYRLIEALPFGTPKPSIGAEPDGQITLEWYASPNQVLSVSVSPDAELHYAALIGENRSYGTEAFSGEVPSTILLLIERILGKCPKKGPFQQ